MLPAEFWGYVRVGWLAALTGTLPGLNLLHRLPAPPARPYDLGAAMKWLDDQTALTPVRNALHADEPGTDPDAIHLLRHDDPTEEDRPTRTRLARLLTLHEMALTYDDTPVLDLVADLRR
ncbi:hypothetical protein ACIOEX_02285 [Streptomyces sp. NPDC087850]|uniref:hypothetical protein n=1 Tax=Streptomyces sp. NPDC087850 TaxID=3365809 RepID=UPI00380D2805